jgi:hypothetical protein
MRKLLLSVTAMLAFATSAQAVSVTGAFGAPDPGPLSGQSVVWSFDGPGAAGYSWSGGLATSCKSISGAAMPAVGPGGTASCFGYVTSAKNPNNATLSTPDLKSISFYWGSIDKYNSVDVLGAGGATIFSIAGGALPPAAGNQKEPNSNRRVNFIAGAGQVITGLRLSSTGVAFEFDTFAAESMVTTAGIPEPASWAMLIAGFGLVGAASRRRNMTVAA